ncbi:MAG: hypothetical protein E7098_05245 [Mediterranea massiliensis]|nr:hypothetical protein [Mediterranea massiliensis]
MKMKDTFFSFPRFANYFKKVLVEDRKRLLQRIITVFGLLVVFGAIISDSCYQHYMEALKMGIVRNEIDPAIDGLMPLFVFGLFIGCALSASFIMEPMSSKTGRIYALMLPATSFEKYFVRWFIYTIGYLVVYYLLFLLVDVMRVCVFSVIYPEIDIITFLNPYAEIVALRDDAPWGFIVSLYLLLQSIFVLGSSLWPKYAFLKTFTAYTILGMAFTAFFAGIMNLFDRPGNSYIMPELSDDTLFLIATCGVMMVTLFFWWLAYKRFKEMEVVNRW